MVSAGVIDRNTPFVFIHGINIMYDIYSLQGIALVHSILLLWYCGERLIRNSCSVISVWDIENVPQSFVGMFSVSGGNIFFSRIQTSERSRFTICLTVWKTWKIWTFIVLFSVIRCFKSHFPKKDNLVVIIAQIVKLIACVSLNFLQEINHFLGYVF